MRTMGETTRRVLSRAMRCTVLTAALVGTGVLGTASASAARLVAVHENLEPPQGHASYALAPGEVSRATFTSLLDRRTLQVRERGTARILVEDDQQSLATCVSTVLVVGACTSPSAMRLSVLGESGNDVFDARGLHRVAAPPPYTFWHGDQWDLRAGGEDVVFASASDDIVYMGAGRDHVDGGAGIDRLDYASRPGSPANQGVQIVLDGPGSGRETTSGDRFHGIEGFVATNHPDTFVGTAADESFESDGGADQVRGGDGADHLRVVDGLVFGEGGDDVLIGAATLDGGAGDDTLYASFPVEAPVLAGDGDDSVRVRGYDEVPSLVSCGDGEDTVYADGVLAWGDPLPTSIPPDCEHLVDARR